MVKYCGIIIYAVFGVLLLITCALAGEIGTAKESAFTWPLFVTGCFVPIVGIVLGFMMSRIAKNNDAQFKALKDGNDAQFNTLKETVEGVRADLIDRIKEHKAEVVKEVDILHRKQERFVPRETFNLTVESLRRDCSEMKDCLKNIDSTLQKNGVERRMGGGVLT